MDMPVIYIDVLFAVNFIINYVLLKTSCIFINLKHNTIRMMLGALIGSIYAILIFFPDFSPLYSTLCKLLISMLILASSFTFYSFSSYFKALIVFYMVSFGFGGCVLGVFYFSDIGARLGAVYSNGIFYFNLPWTILAVSGIAFYIAVRIFDFISRKHFSAKSLKKKLYLTYDNKTAEITALLDTGNSLMDPVSMSPVIIAEYKSIKNLFSSEIRNSLERIDNDNLPHILSEVGEKGLRARLIPFSSLGNENGMLLGFIPDKAELRDECGIRTLGKCVIAIYEKNLTCDRSYGALLNPYLQ